MMPRDEDGFDDITGFTTTSTSKKRTDPIAHNIVRPAKGNTRMQGYPAGRGSQLIAKVIQGGVVGIAALAVFYALFAFTSLYILLVPGMLGALAFSVSLESSVYIWWHTSHNSPTEYGHWGATAMALFVIAICLCAFIVVVLHAVGQLKPDNTLIIATQIMIAVYVIVSVPVLWACHRA